MKPKYQFSNVVIVNEGHIGVILKTFKNKNGYFYDVYVRLTNSIEEFNEADIDHLVYDKVIPEYEDTIVAKNMVNHMMEKMRLK